MIKSKQNQVPPEYEKFYSPMLKLKQVLQSNKQTLELDKNEFMIHGLMVLHFATFFICNVYRMADKADNDKVFLIRGLIETMLEKGSFTLEATNTYKLISFIDLIGKNLNTVISPRLHIAMYHGYLDYEIYYFFHDELGLFDFKWCCHIEEKTAKQMKDYHDASVALINKMKI